MGQHSFGNVLGVWAGPSSTYICPLGPLSLTSSIPLQYTLSVTSSSSLFIQPNYLTSLLLNTSTTHRLIFSSHTVCSVNMLIYIYFPIQESLGELEVCEVSPSHAATATASVVVPPALGARAVTSVMASQIQAFDESFTVK